MFLQDNRDAPPSTGMRISDRAPRSRAAAPMAFAGLNDSRHSFTGAPLHKGNLRLLAHPHVAMSKQLYQFVIRRFF